MNWDDVRVFLAVARTGSLNLGAKAAEVDRSTASRRVTALERAVGARLLLRGRDGVQLSPAGERLLRHAERMDDGATSLRRAARDEGAVRGVVRLATTESLAAFLVREGLLDVRARHPELEVELLGGNRPVDLSRGEADLALRVTPVTDASLRVRRLIRLSFACFASTAYTRRKGRPRDAHEIAGHDVVVPGGELAKLPEAQWLASQEGVRVALRTSSMTALLAAMSAGVGITVLPAPWGAREESAERLFDVAEVPARPLFLVSHPDVGAGAAVRVVADAVAEIVRRPA